MKFIAQFIDIKQLFTVFLMGVCFSPASLAQDDTALVYAPTSTWLVGPANLPGNLGDRVVGNIPCVVTNQFGNGFIVRLSGGGEQLMAMAIDFQQKVFEPHRKYEVGFSVPGVFFQAFQGAAYDQQILLFGLQKIPDFYAALKQADRLVITVAGASVALELAGLEDGFRRMEQCYHSSVPQQASGGTPPSGPNLEKQGNLQNPLIAQEAGLIPMPGEEERPVAPVLAQEAPSIPAPDARLSVDAVLNAVAPEQPPVKGGSAGHFIAKAQEAEEAARRLSAQSPSKPADPVTGGEGGAPPKIIRPHGADIMAGNASAPVKSTERNMRFRALKGANLQNVLELWAEGAGIRLLWLSDRDFAVQRSLSLEGSLETALQSLLGQYEGEGPRPVGRVYREPGTQSQVLVVERREK